MEFYQRVRKTSAALKLMDPDQEYFHDAFIVLDAKNQSFLTVQWRNPELAGIWQLVYQIEAKVFANLLSDKMLAETREPQSGEIRYRLRKK